MAARINLLIVVLLCSVSAFAQSTDVKDVQQARIKLIVGTDGTKYLSSILQTISGAATHNQSPTAKAVYDYIQSLNLLSTVSTTARISGAGTSGSPLDIAQQGATTGEVLRWSGSAWVPDGTNLYSIVTTSQTVGAQYNQVWAEDTGTPYTLNLPACNSANNGVRIEVNKTDAYPVGGGGGDTAITIEPAGSEEFADGTTQKILYSSGTGISCTCRWTGSAGYWLFTNM